LNCTIPALVNRSVGSSAGTRGELGTSWCPRALKNSRNLRRISAEVMGENIAASATQLKGESILRRQAHRLGIPAPPGHGPGVGLVTRHPVGMNPGLAARG